MKHQINIKKYEGELEDLAEDIGNLRYDALNYFIACLSLKLQRDGAKDLMNDRPQLAKELISTSSVLEEAGDHIDEAWKISEPYIQDSK